MMTGSLQTIGAWKDMDNFRGIYPKGKHMLAEIYGASGRGERVVSGREILTLPPIAFYYKPHDRYTVQEGTESVQRRNTNMTIIVTG